jgi:hypothetical protein
VLRTTPKCGWPSTTGEKHWIWSFTRRGDIIISEGHVPGRPSQLHGRPAVYLDQNHWRKVADVLVDPQRVADAHEREAAVVLQGLASDAGIVLPLSSAHLYETGPLYGDRRYDVGVAMAQLSGGWQLRNPISVWKQEVRAIVADALGIPTSTRPPLAEVITLEPHALLRESPSNVDSDGLEALKRVISGPSITVDLLIDPVPDAPTALDKWRVHHQGISAQFAREPGVKNAKRKVATRRFWNENISWVHDAARALGHPTSSLPMLSDGELRRALEAAPMLRYLSTLFVSRFLDSRRRWRDNDLTDMAFLACATGYADYVVSEAGTGAQLQQTQRSLGLEASVFTTLSAVVDALRKAGVQTAALKVASSPDSQPRPK